MTNTNTLSKYNAKGKVARRAANSGTNDTSARVALLKSATRLFANQGLRGTSIRDIARHAKVNSSMISYYFESKEGLYRACLKQIGQNRFDMAQKILKTPKTKEEYKVRLNMFIENTLTLFIDDREVGLIIIREFDRANSPAGKIFKDGFLKVFDLLLNFFKDAQSLTFIPKKTDPYILTSVFFGTITNQMRMDHILEKTYGRSLKDPVTRQNVLDQLINFFTNL